MVPEEKVAAGPKSRARVQPNGLPEGVKILPIGSQDPDIVAQVAGLEPNAEDSEPSDEATVDAAGPAPTPLIHGRSRLAATADQAPAKRRKPGRPKAGRLDVPRTIASTAPTPLPTAPKITPAAAPPPPSHRSMSDIAPRRAAAPPHHAPKAAAPAEQKADTPPAKAHRPHAHRVGVPPLHYGPVLAFSLRARARPRLVALAALGAVSLGAASAYGIWILLTGGVAGLADSVLHGGPKLVAEAALLAVIYYVGRSLGQTAIIYGIAREADQRPVTLSRQFGVAINTFGRRLRLDIGYGLAELALVAAGVALFMTGGQAWPVNSNVQIGLIFTAYLAILYFLAGLALSRGLAEVNLTLTTHKPATAAKVGWQLFSHRVELVGPRFGAVLMEAALAVPLLALGVAMVISAAPQFHLEVAVGAGLLAWLAGALMGVGTASWWAMLYRQLVLADRPASAVALLSTRQPEDAHRAPLALIVAISTLTLAATLILPWLQLG